MGERILIVGGGGREHALAWKCLQSPLVDDVFCAPGNAAMGPRVQNVPIAATNIPDLAVFAAENGVTLTVVGPEAPLMDGIVDYFAAAGLRAYGPSRLAARLEGSKAEAKQFMSRWNIPTAAYTICSTKQEALRFVQQSRPPLVIKADGLAAGKGVIVAETEAEAVAAVENLSALGQVLVLEEFLSGEEVSLLAFVDGEIVRPLEPAQDHKPILEGDLGPNTGGMGAYSPVQHIPSCVYQQAVTEILEPTARAMVQEGNPFRGVLYAGLIVTEQGPKVIEFNVRFGDPEAQVLLPRLETDLMEILLASFTGCLDQQPIRWSSQTAAAVVAASGGYPGKYLVGQPISGSIAADSSASIVFAAGIRRQNGQLCTDGGRVFASVGLADDLEAALAAAYARIETISFPRMYYRRDIGFRARREPFVRPSQPFQAHRSGSI